MTEKLVAPAESCDPERYLADLRANTPPPHRLLSVDIAGIRTIRFRRERSDLVKAREDLSRFIGEGMSRSFNAVMAARHPAGSSRRESLSEGDDEDVPGLFDRLARAEEQMGSLVADLEAMGEALTYIARLAEEAAPEMHELSNAPASAKLAVMKRFSDSISEPSAGLRSSAERFAERMTDVDAAVHASLDFVAALPPAERDAETKEFLEQLVETAEATRSGTAEMSTFGAVMRSVMGISRLLRDPGRDISAAVRVVVAVVGRTDAWEKRARALL